MSQFFEIHAGTPQKRLITQSAAILRGGGVIVYPTDSCYALGCCLGDKQALARIRRLRGLGDEHAFTLMCRDLSELATYARVSNSAYRMLRACTPGPYTFILKATREVPRRLQHPRRRTIGLRVPDNATSLALLETLGEPLMSTSLILPGDDLPLADAGEAYARLGAELALVIDGGVCGVEPTTVVDLTDEIPRIVRSGLGDVRPFQPS